MTMTMTIICINDIHGREAFPAADTLAEAAANARPSAVHVEDLQ